MRHAVSALFAEVKYPGCSGYGILRGKAPGIVQTILRQDLHAFHFVFTFRGHTPVLTGSLQHKINSAVGLELWLDGYGFSFSNELP